MSETLCDELIHLLHHQVPDGTADYFQLSADLDHHRLWLEYDKPQLLLMLARPDAVAGASATDFIVQGPGEPVLLLFDTWFRGQAVQALFVEPCLGERTRLLATCDLFLRRCTAPQPAQE